MDPFKTILKTESYDELIPKNKRCEHRFSFKHVYVHDQAKFDLFLTFVIRDNLNDENYFCPFSDQELFNSNRVDEPLSPNFKIIGIYCLSNRVIYVRIDKEQVISEVVKHEIAKAILKAQSGKTAIYFRKMGGNFYSYMNQI